LIMKEWVKFLLLWMVIFGIEWTKSYKILKMYFKVSLGEGGLMDETFIWSAWRWQK